MDQTTNVTTGEVRFSYTDGMTALQVAEAIATAIAGVDLSLIHISEPTRPY